MRPLALLLLYALSIAAPPVLASPPVPSKKSISVESYERQLKQQKASQKELKRKQKDIQSDLKGTQKDLVALASDIQENERDLNALNERIDKLETEKDETQERLQKDRGSIGELILALERIRRVPPEALIARPDAPLKTAQSAMLLQNILPRIHEKTERLKNDLERLEEISEDLDDKKDRLEKRSADLKEQHTELSKLVSARKKLYASTQTDLEQRTANIRQISAKAQNLKDLVERLDKDRERERTRALSRKAVLTIPDVRNIAPGKARLPISGKVVTHFNAPDNFGAPSQGIDIEGRGGGLVVAPLGGIVKFAGPFKNYGEMVILEHRDGYHSLVAGLEKIDTVIGQNVEAGEPLGRLHHSTNRQKPVLYYELRYNGKPVNPSRKFSELRT